MRGVLIKDGFIGIRRALKQKKDQNAQIRVHWPAEDIPVEEIEVFVRRIEASAALRDVDHVAVAYAEAGAETIDDPFAPLVTNHICMALEKRIPYSAIRLGDTEANILAFGTFDDTPFLDRHAVEASLHMQSDTFELQEVWFSALADRMALSVLSADIVGVLGLWRPNKAQPLQAFVESFRKDPRGLGGQWHGRHAPLQLARGGQLKGRIAATAHFYFGVAKRIDRLIDAARTVLCVTSQKDVVDDLRRRHPGKSIELIVSGRTKTIAALTAPEFLETVRTALPRDMQGCLCLIGAGPWTEYYCTWVKARGGVAVDLGSGFDLLSGNKTRPIHRARWSQWQEPVDD